MDREPKHLLDIPGDDATAAKRTFALFLAYTDAGFTEASALYLVGVVLHTHTNPNQMQS